MMWVYEPIRRVRKAEFENVTRDRACLLCDGTVVRVAERRPEPPYQWVPNGYICQKCNSMFMGVM